ncbi:helix-turn-helix transcriptional regulator [Nonomuraea sp. LPB2021202275-12-8]|uniref:helix-turn-helix transcriptional regulator n=1 Tax=Nonomuraea sp. LPB2021202275-12-8 TaxID=3120159 RepID=UPI00300C65FB
MRADNSRRHGLAISRVRPAHGKLESLGLSKLAEGVYRLLLTGQDLDVEAIAGQMRANPGQIRQALDQLADLALLRPSWEAPGAMRAVNPEAGLQMLLQRRQAELLRQQQSIVESQAAITALVSQYADLRPGDGHPVAERLIGLDAIRSRIEALAARARIEVATLMPGGPQDPAMIEAAKPLDQQVRERGVAIRTVGLDCIRRDGPTLAFAYWLVGIGAQVRTVPSLPARMIIYDRRTALVPLDPADTRAGAVQLDGPGTVSVVLALFEQIWSTATPIGSSPVRDGDGLSPQERQLLRLLAEGMTDEGAGRQLGLAPRTVRRIMADVMGRLGARSRFEAGLRASERGWL